MKHLLLFLALFYGSIHAQVADSTSRVIKMEGTVNFRDMGGYPTLNGRKVIARRLFRSATIAQLTPNDLRTLTELKVHTVIDLRGTKESAIAPDRLLPHTDYTLCPAGSDSLPSGKEMIQLLKDSNFLMGMYGEKSLSHFGGRNRPFFQKLLTLPDNESLLVHCTGGRDRTGMASALLLYALNVPMEIIEQDFLASNVYLAPMNQRMYAPLAQMTGLSTQEIEAKMMLKPAYLEAFFSTLTTHYGSIEGFLEKECGIGPKELDTLRKKYTTDK